MAIPFFARANRAPTDFTVWVPERAPLTSPSTCPTGESEWT